MPSATVAERPLLATGPSGKRRRLRSDDAELLARANPAAIVVDLSGHVVYRGGELFELERGPTLLPLVRLFVENPGVAVSAERIATEALSVDYHPLRHRSRVSMAVGRVKKILGADGVQAVADGYIFRAAGGVWLVAGA